jgi:cell division protein FtsI (penicillin-binding protein 3)
VRDYRRIYPQGRLAAHVVGFTDIDNVGVSGVESSLDELLRTQNDPLKLSLDTRLQHIVQTELQGAIEKFGCMGGSGALMDLHTGEVLAMVSLPDFDPNKPMKADQNALFNAITLGIYEMGSIMKIPNTAMALESGKIELGTRFDAGAPLKVGRFTITDFRANHGMINVAEIFVYSSNKGSARIALSLGGDYQKAFLQKSGFLSAPTIELPEKGAPMVPKRWREDKVITISYGYGLSMSPLQVLTGIGSLVRPWGRMTPTLLAKDANAPIRGERLVSEKTSRSLLHLMRFVVTHGTSRKADVPGYFIGGKTGTRDMLINGRYNKARVSTTFLGVLGKDVSNVRYILLVRLDDPQRMKETYGFNTAGWNAAPLGGRILERVAGVTGVLPREEGKITEPFFRNVSFGKK